MTEEFVDNVYILVNNASRNNPYRNELNMELPKLEEIAAFAMAKHLWHSSGAYKKLLNFIAEEFFGMYSLPKIYTYEKNESVKKDLVRSWPNLPKRIVNIINSAIECVGEEIFAWIRLEHCRCTVKDVKYHFENLNFYDISWSPFLTIDQMKSQCKTKEFNLRDGKLCDCCFKYSVDKAYPVVIPYLTWFRHIYGDYAQYALAFIVHFGQEYFRFKEHIFSIFFRNGSAVENIFKLSVLCAYDTGVRYYWSKLTEEQRKKNLPKLIEICLNQWFGRDSKLLIFPKKESNTFCFLWSKLSYNDQINLEDEYSWALSKALWNIES